MNTIAIAAYTRTENCLWKIIADIQPKLAPDLLADIVSYAIAYITLFKKIADCFDSFTVFSTPTVSFQAPEVTPIVDLRSK